MAIAYKYPETGEIVTREQWRWVAFYNDGTKLEQFEISNGSAIFHRFAEIDTDKLCKLELVHDTCRPVVVFIPSGAKPIHFYRHRIINSEIIDNVTGEKMNREEKLKFYCIGFEIDGNAFLVFVDEFGAIELTNDKDHFNHIGENNG